MRPAASLVTLRLRNFAYPDAAVKSPHSGVAFCCFVIEHIHAINILVYIFVS